jgi:hypothetical protein
VKEVFESKPEGSRRMRKPRLRWLECLEKDSQEMKIKRRRQKSVDREEWAPVIKEAMGLKGP